MSIAWDAFLSVVIVSIVGTAAIVTLFSLGVRWMTDAELVASQSKKSSRRGSGKEVALRTIAYLAFTLAALGVLYEIYLIVPLFHLDK